jgi:4-amino-4-deoxy-L-arabinose transferase-like glycosyltransferase
MPTRITPARRRVPAALLALLLITWAVLLIRLNAPWFGLYDENGAWISIAVRNYRLYGASHLAFLQTLNTGPVIDPATPDVFLYYNHHPPLIVWTIALASQVFGFHEATARWVAAALTLISVAAIYALARRLGSRSGRRAIWVAALYALSPAMLYFGRMPDHECLALAIGLLLAAVWVDWLRRPTRGRWLILAGLAILAAWSAWAALPYVGGLALWGAWRASGRQRLASLALGGVGLLATIGLLAYYQAAWPGTLSDLTNAFLWRTSSASFGPQSATFSTGAWIGHQFVDTAIIYTPIGLLLAVAGAVWIVRRESRWLREMLLVLGAIGVGYLLLLRNASYIHSYYKLFLAPPIALAAGTLAAAVFAPDATGRLRRWGRPLLIGLLLAGAGITAMLVAQYHATGEQPFLEQAGVQHSPLEVARAFEAVSLPSDQIWSNLKRASSALEYYAFREITWATSPDAALASLEDTPAGAVYALCGDEPAPPELAAFPDIELAGCRFYRLRVAAP